MPIGINGTGSITGISAGGLPDASVNTEDLNAGTASSGQKLVASGASGAMTWGSSIVSGTAQNSTSGTSIDFTGIPSWVKRITVMFNGVSTSGTSNLMVQIGDGSVNATGYNSAATQLNTSSMTTAANSTGFMVTNSIIATSITGGNVTITLIGSNTWTQTGSLVRYDGITQHSAGVKSLTGTLDRVRITTVNGTDTFDAGSINIFYE